MQYLMMALSAIFSCSFKSKYGFGYKINKSLFLSASTLGKESITSPSKECIDRSHTLEKFKEIIRNQSIDVFLVPTDDPHLSEYTAPYYARR